MSTYEEWPDTRDGWRAHCKSVEAENKRLREALEHTAALIKARQLAKAERIARGALAQEESE